MSSGRYGGAEISYTPVARVLGGTNSLICKNILALHDV